MILEVCCGDLDSVLAAKAAGAQRIELCSALSEGGLTPSLGLIEAAVAAGIPTLHVLIRPRNGDFLYSDAEVDMMVRDITHAIQAGADGVVIGALTPDGDVDISACSRMIEAAQGRSVTFHRAFDLCREPETALEAIINLGCDRILTSGLAPSASAGVATLRRLNQLAGGRITILAGGGINATNAPEILRACNLTEVHASAKKNLPSAMRFRRDSVSMGSPEANEYTRQVTDKDNVASILAAINQS